MDELKLFGNLPPKLRLTVGDYLYYCKVCQNKCFIEPQWNYCCDVCGWSCCPKESWSDEPEGCGGGCLCMTQNHDDRTPIEDTFIFYSHKRPLLVKTVRLIESRVRFVECDYFDYCYGGCRNAVRYRKDEHGPFNNVNHGVLCHEHRDYYYTPTCSKKYCGEPGSTCYCKPGWHKD